MHSGHFEMVRMTTNRKMDASKMFAIWRVDGPWQPLTRKVISPLSPFLNKGYILCFNFFHYFNRAKESEWAVGNQRLTIM